MNSDETIFIELAEAGRQYYLESIKLLLFKDNPDVFELIDFENENIYQEPLLFAYFNFPEESNLSIENILYGYMRPEGRPRFMEANSDEHGRIYLANFGWIITGIPTEKFTIRTSADFSISVLLDNSEVGFEFEPIIRLEKEGPEVVKHPVPLLRECYLRVDDIIIDFDVTDITKERTQDLVKAWELMEELIPTQYELIKKMTKKMVIFNIYEGTANSFATKNAQGTGFFHAYQKEYNEVFFIDDIAHQTGHVIFYAITCDREKYLKIDPDTFLQTFTETMNQGRRTVYVLFHALYTYYTTLKFLEQALIQRTFEGEKEHEVNGRMHFYLCKYMKDVAFLENSIGTDTLFTEDGLKIYNKITTDIQEIIEEWLPKVEHLDVSEQTYNFAYSIFEKLNPLEKVHH